VFVIGLISAGYSSADGTFTALTTSICYDIIHIEKRVSTDRSQLWVRRCVHFGISLLFLAVILIAAQYHNDALIRIIFMVAGYTYGPLLGLFAFGIFTRRQVKYPVLIPLLSIVIPLFCWLLSHYSEQLLWGYKFGFEILILNGGLQFLMLLAISKKGDMIEDKKTKVLRKIINWT
jgi:Na+/proline symporter